ncbi:transposase [Paenirhodobacter sp.]|uniref:transposase n=1 Tax=Paenirhodobacter sp. TaxID=1965326 RepID=UPI003B50E4F5
MLTGLPTSGLCRKHALIPATFCELKARYGGMELSDARRLKRLEDENAKLKRLLAGAMLALLCSRISWESPDDADAAAGRRAAGHEGSSDPSTPVPRPDRCRSEDGAA